MSQSRVWIDWPVWIMMLGPLPASLLLEWAGRECIWAASPLLIVGGLCLGVLVTFIVTARVSDYSGQPWAFFAFVLSSASWVLSVFLLFAFAPSFK